MKTIFNTLLFVLALSISVLAQTPASSPTPTTSAPNPSDATTATTTSTKRPPVFKANKDQVMQAQKMLKDKGMYAGEETGKLDDATREALGKYQTAESMPATGTLNRATLEKMNIALTDKQTAMPDMSAKQMETPKEPKQPRAKTFRATKDQIMQAQKMLKSKSLYAGEENGKRNDDFRAAVVKYQQAEGLQTTGTLNRETVEKMGISLTDKQKATPSVAATAPATK